MTTTMNLILILLLSVVSVLSEETVSPSLLNKQIVTTNGNNSCDPSSLDTTVQWLFYLQHPSRQVPGTLSEMTEFCAEKDVIESTVDEYGKRCLEQLPKTVTELLMLGIKRQNRYYCSSSTKAKTDLLDSARCLRLIKDTGSQCMNALIVDMLSVLSSPSKKRIGRLCW